MFMTVKTAASARNQQPDAATRSSRQLVRRRETMRERTKLWVLSSTLLIAAAAACKDPRPTPGSAPAHRSAADAAAIPSPRAADAASDRPRARDANPATFELEPYERKGACEITLQLIVPRGTPRNAELARELEQLAVAHAVGPWEPGKRRQRADLKPFFATKFTQDGMMAYAFGIGTREQLVEYVIGEMVATSLRASAT